MKWLQMVVVAVMMSGEFSILPQNGGSCSHMWQCIIHADAHINEVVCKESYKALHLHLNIFVYFKVISICKTS